MIATAEHPVARVLSELAVNAAPENARLEPYTAEELLDWPRPGFGKHVDVVLRLTTAERVYLAGAVLETIEHS